MYMRVCIMRVRMYTYMYVCMYVCMYVYVCKYVCIYLYTCMLYVCVYTTHIHMHQVKWLELCLTLQINMYTSNFILCHRH